MPQYVPIPAALRNPVGFQQKLIEELEEFNMLEENPLAAEEQASVNLLKDHLKITPYTVLTHVTVIAVNSSDLKDNRLLSIKCEKGTPLGGYVYDTVNDCYRVLCVGYSELGYIPMAFRLTIGAGAAWRLFVPMIEEVLVKYMNEEQKEALEKFKDQYDTECYFEYLQVVD